MRLIYSTITMILYLSNQSRKILPLKQSKDLLRSFWIERLEKTEPQCKNIVWTCEHVIPKSMIREHNDLHNLILLPARINNARSNFKYIQGLGHDDIYKSNLTLKEVVSCGKLCDISCKMKAKSVSNKFFMPPDLFKGMIGRSVLQMTEKYPYHKNLVNKCVLDLGVASIWDYYYPATIDEMIWNDIVEKFQGDTNAYVSKSFRNEEE